MRKIAIIPIDDRPICYTLLEQICAIDEDIKLFLPPRNLLGGLKTQANVELILAWLEELLKVQEIDNLILSLDTIAYGGLVSSRRSEETFDEISKRLNTLKNIINGKAEKVFAFSSIMRISNNNINEEEKEYWSQWGKRIFEYSYNLHWSEITQSSNCVINQVPADILEDYIKTRERNFKVNKIYLEWLGEGVLDFMVYSKDDSGEYGLNIKEARELQILIAAHGLNALVKTGADEIPLALLARALAEDKNVTMASICLESARGSVNTVSKYEDISVHDCIQGQMQLAKVKMAAPDDAQIVMIVNNFQTEQGDLVLGERINYIRADVLKRFQKMLTKINVPYCIADINNANGADNNFLQYMPNLKSERFYGYTGYNTTANTLGCSICVAVVKFLATRYNHDAFKKLQFIRFMDDWAYQANIRKCVRDAAPDFSGGLKKCKSVLGSFAKKIEKQLDIHYKNVEYTLPWDRSFEIEINVR